MNTMLTRRGAVQALAAAALVGAVIGLAGCQSARSDTMAPTPTPAQQHAPGADVPQGYEGQTADRIEQELQRQIDRGVRPASACLDYSVVEHTDGGFHLVCAQKSE